MTGHCGLRQIEAAMDVAHTDLTGLQQREDPQPRAVCQRLEQYFQRRESLVSSHEYMRLDKYSTDKYIRFGIYVSPSVGKKRTS